MKKVIMLIILLTGMINITYADDSIAYDNSGNKYAVIINAVSDIEHNYIRYWNDCSAVYQALLLRGFPSSNIFVAMSGGTNSYYDCLNEHMQPQSLPFDLNGDGNDDIQYAASREDIEHIFNELSNIMTGDKDLFIYTVGKGTVDTLNFYPHHLEPPYIYNPIFTSYLTLWGGEDRLAEGEFAQMLEPISARTINIVMQQSHSGGFVDALRGMDNVVITTSCNATGKSYSMENKQYDEFTYHWVSAIIGDSPYNLYPYNQTSAGAINSDENQDGYITMFEAYSYVTTHNTKNEHTIIESNSDCLKHSLALDTLLYCFSIPGWDLYMQDNPIDIGEEPNITTEESWITREIWFEHNGQKIDRLQSGETYDVCVTVRNRGEATSPNNAKLYVHWTKATIGSAWPWGWYDEYTYDCDGNAVRRGGLIDSVLLPPIAGGGEYVAKIAWTTPNIEEYIPCLSVFGNNMAELMHYCVLARIVDEQEQPDETITNLGLAEFVLNHNNVVSRNVIIATVINDDASNPHIEEIVDISNPLPGLDSGPYTLTCHIEGEEGWDNMASVRLTFDSRFMSSQAYMTWSNCYADNTCGCFYLEDGALFEDIYFWSNDNNTYPIKLNIDYFQTYNLYPEFTVKLVLRNQDGIVVNGELFEFRNNRPDLANVIKRPTTTESQNDLEQQLIVQEETLSIDVYNLQGLHLKHCESCDVESLNLPQGIYILYVHTESQSYKMKIIR